MMTCLTKINLNSIFSMPFLVNSEELHSLQFSIGKEFINIISSFDIVRCLASYHSETVDSTKS